MAIFHGKLWNYDRGYIGSPLPKTRLIEPIRKRKEKKRKKQQQQQQHKQQQQQQQQQQLNYNYNFDHKKHNNYIKLEQT